MGLIAILYNNHGNIIKKKLSYKIFLLIRRILCLFLGYNFISDKGIIFQKGLFDCGTACLEMIFEKYNIYPTKNNETQNDNIRMDPINDQSECYNVKEFQNYKRGCMSMLDMKNILSSNSFISKGYIFNNIDQFYAFVKKNKYTTILFLMENFDKILFSRIISLVLFPLKKFVKLKNPLIKYNIYHWVVLDKFSENYFYLRDPFFGYVKIEKSKFDRIWSKYILLALLV